MSVPPLTTSASDRARDTGAYDGVDARDLRARLGVPRVVALREAGSTLDIAHALGEAGTPAGTLVVADRQTAGRGRMGRAWSSPAGSGLWLALLERGVDADAIAVLSLRMGLALAPALDPFAASPVQLKWPNDLYAGDGKLGGILAEARWRDTQLEWVAIGVGINVRMPPGVAGAAALRDDVTRLDVLAAIVAPMRAAAARRGPLGDEERASFAARDLARGRRCTAPVAGTCAGVASDGALLVEREGAVHAAHSGSLILAEERP